MGYPIGFTDPGRVTRRALTERLRILRISPSKKFSQGSRNRTFSQKEMSKGSKAPRQPLNGLGHLTNVPPLFPLIFITANIFTGLKPFRHKGQAAFCKRKEM